jgi:hypothetical protein
VRGKLYLVMGMRKKWGGKRFARCCSVPVCGKLAQGMTEWCKNHGGGTRCKTEGCPRAARGGSDHCAGHGGGKRCSFKDCLDAAISTSFCRRHGGGRTCKFTGCVKNARGRTDFCVQHGGGVRCSVANCNSSGRGAAGSISLCRRHRQRSVESGGSSARLSVSSHTSSASTGSSISPTSSFPPLASPRVSDNLASSSISTKAIPSASS